MLSYFCRSCGVFSIKLSVSTFVQHPALLITSRNVLQRKIDPLEKSGFRSEVLFASVCFCHCMHRKLSGVVRT
jgi:hypothetical protein